MDELPESDRLLDFPHPREQSTLIGHDAAEHKLFTAYAGAKMPHAWIIGGPRGVGKATLAYRMARFVLANPDPENIDAKAAESLFVAPENPVFKRVAGLGHADLYVARRPYDPKSKRLRAEITADQVRKTSRFYAHTAGEGGWRICIIDAADDMNRTAANALLKILEEPPARALFFLVSHTPGRLLATIKSRCVTLNLRPLDLADFSEVLGAHLNAGEMPGEPDLTTLAELCGGGPGQALALIRGKGWDTFKTFNRLLERLPDLDAGACASFADKLGARGAEEDYRTFCRLLTEWLAARVRGGALGAEAGGDGQGRSPLERFMTPARLPAWAEAWQEISRSIARANALNLDRKHTILQTLYTLEETASARNTNG